MAAMTRREFRDWIAANQREIILYGLLFLAGFNFGRVAGRHERD